MKKQKDMPSKKTMVLERLYEICKERDVYEFDNTLVKKVSAEIGFGNPFDATKIDNKSGLPRKFRVNDIAVLHLGNGRHKFINGIDKIYHDFEPIEEYVKWNYRKSLLNQFNSSESNLLSIANNQRILHHFLFGRDTELDDVDIMKRPKTYFPHRTKTSLQYYVDDTYLELDRIQLEIDLTIEFEGRIGIFEAKNGCPKNFSIYQLYHPFLYYYNANKDSSIQGRIKEVFGVYVVRMRYKYSNDIIRLWAYTFDVPTDMSSIRLIKSAEYELINR